MPINERYEPLVLEKKWQERWEREGLFRAGRRPNAPKKYVLEMLPYPSGKMHMGHVRNYLLGDIYARYFAMKGFDVLHPLGWDSFGLPAENAAIKDGVHPAVRTRENIASFKHDVISLGLSYDWSRELNSCEPEYYRWNQWFFVKMLEKGLVYRRFSKVNWCTGCLTVIANEQVKDGTCERCDSPVQEREMPEWAFRITRYSQALLEGLDGLTAWPDRVTGMQRNWIGRSEGVEVDFPVENGSPVRVFTTRADTLFGCTYLVLAPDHAQVLSLTTAAQRPEVEGFVAEMAVLDHAQRFAEGTEKRGVFTGSCAVHPLTGAPIPIWIANFVISGYGTGAVMSVPAHDERDFAFARKYGLPIKPVVRPVDSAAPNSSELQAAFTAEGLLFDSGSYTGLPSAEGRRKITAELEAEGKGKATVTWRQRDWGFSRQRYWGTPIPILYCERCDPNREGIPVPEADLPVVLPEIDVQEVLTGKGQPPLAKVPSFVNTTCPKCGGAARREVETMDTFVDSAWYYARYLSPHLDTAPFEATAANRWLPIDIYVGGPEHAVMHLLYFRFWSRVMKELGLTPSDEPVTRLIAQGIVNGSDGRKMSKRWGNVISPASLVQKYGADTVRVYVAFAGPPERDFDWSDDQVEGAFRFLRRVWTLVAQHQPEIQGATYEGAWEGEALELRRATHKCIQRVTQSIERLSFNTAVAGVMELVNALYAAEKPSTQAEKAAMAEAVSALTLLLTPFAPHMADEIAEGYGQEVFTVSRAWPEFDPALVVDDVIPYAVQVNGKLRAEVRVATGAGEQEVRQAAEADERVKAYLTGKTVRKVVFVPKRLLNYVVG